MNLELIKTLDREKLETVVMAQFERINQLEQIRAGIKTRQDEIDCCLKILALPCNNHSEIVIKDYSISNEYTHDYEYKWAITFISNQA